MKRREHPAKLLGHRRRWRLGVSALLLAVSLLLAHPSASASLEEAAQAASRASELTPLVRTLREEVEALGASAPPTQLDQAAESLGKLVTRARDLDASREQFEALARTGRSLRTTLARVREGFEVRAGEDEQALEALYRSEDWRRLDYAEVTLGYWLGWALLGQAERTPSKAPRRELLKEAERAFSRSAMEVALPRIAGMSQLGLGIVWNQLGQSQRAERALERFDREIAPDLPASVQAAARHQLALLAFEAGDVARGQQWLDRIPEGVLGSDAVLDLVRMEASARLERMSGDAPASAAELDRVASLLRRLAAAGGRHARAASALVLEHRRRLAGLDVGPAGELVEAEEAFAEERYAEASRAYGRALAREEQLGGLDLVVARYKFAFALARTGGDRARALAQLEAVLDAEGASAVRKPAARLYHSLAAQQAAADPDAEARARRAARLLLEIDPQAPEADRARLRLARSGEAPEGEDRIAMLEGVPEFSEVYPAARMELVRIRADALQRLESRGRGEGQAARRLARALAEDLDRVSSLVSEGRLAPDPARDATLAVLRAKAAERAGDPPERVLALAAEAAESPALDRAARRALLRLRLRVLRQAGRFEALGELFAGRSDGAVRRDWTAWYEAARDLDAQRAPRAPAGLLVRLYGRLGELAPEKHRDDLALAEAEALLAAGRAERAVQKARALVEADPAWGDAQILYARALESAEALEEAEEAWGLLARGVDPASPVWVEAQLGLARTRRAAGDAEGACQAVQALEAREDLPSDSEKRLRDFAGLCERFRPRQGSVEAAGPSGTSPP